MKLVKGRGAHYFGGFIAGAFLGALVGALFGFLAGKTATGLAGGAFVGALLGEFVGAAAENPAATEPAAVEEKWSPVKRYALLTAIAILFWGGFIGIAWLAQ